MRTKKSFRMMSVLVLMALVAAFPFSASASHAWGSYHWARTANPFTSKVVDSMTTNWDDNLDIAIGDWNSSSVMNVVKEAGSDEALLRKDAALYLQRDDAVQKDRVTRLLR